MSFRSLLFPAVLGVMILFLAPCSKNGSGDVKNGDMSEMVLGRVAGQEFTLADLQKKLDYQFGSQLEGLTGAQAAAQYREIVLSGLDELCWVRLAEEKQYDKDPVFIDTWELSRRYILAKRAIDLEVRAHSEPTDDEIRTYYDENRDEFLIPTRVQLAHVQVGTKTEAETVQRRLEAGEAIADVAADVSIDTRTKADGGLLGWVTSTSGAAHLGRVPEINTAGMRLQKGDVSPPVKLPGDKGWTVLFALDRTEEGPRPLDDALIESVRNRVRTAKHNELFKNLLSQLKDEYGYEFFEENYDRYAATLLSEEELFRMAQREKLPEKKVEGYRRVMTQYPTSRYASQALFMIGFVLADEINDYPKARDEFRKFLTTYPDHELAESARWMLDNMDKPDPDPEQLKEVRRRANSGP